MTIPLNYQNQQIPAYSGVTINVTHPNMNAGNPICNHQQLPIQPCVQHSCPYTMSQIPTYAVPQQPPVYNMVPQPMPMVPQNPNVGLSYAQPYPVNNQPENASSSYPAQYYLNNYNYVNGNPAQGQAVQPMGVNQPQVFTNNPEALNQVPVVDSFQQQEVVEDTTKSTNIINELDDRLSEQKDLEKNGKKTKIIALTDEYIMSLENYLNNPNSEIRLMAAKEVLTRFDEDKDRYNDAALNALVNKMLQDPEKLIRIAALSALSSQLASGNDYTVQLLNQIQSNPNADKEDVVQAADILLKMSADTETKYTQVSTVTPVVNQQAKPEQGQIE